jgi:hypothetical protein
MRPDERNKLIDALCDGAISEPDFLRLQGELIVNSDARAGYYERLKLHTALELESEGLVLPFPRRPRSFTLLAVLATAAAVVLAGILTWPKPRPESAKVEPAASGFGVVAEQSDASWGLSRGDLLPQGMLRLESGVAELELFSGVTIIVEDDCEFEVLSPMEISVRTGTLRANVPRPATGFRVRTTSGEIVDIGTDFSLAVTPTHADMHVIGGKIEWHPTSKPMRTLTEGQSLRWTATGEPQNVKFQAPAAVDFATQRDARRAGWQAHSRELRKDPRLLAYFPMDQPGGWSRQLIDEAGAERHGTIVRAKRSADRWDKTSALDFSPTGSRVRLNIPGDHRSLTFICWVRIDSLDRWFNSLFLTDGHELHEPHWQIMDDGRLFFSVKKRNARNDKYIAYSPPFWTPALSGKWLQIATVYNVDAKTTTHYVNGEQLSRHRIPDADVVETVRIGAASIGNWSEPKREDPHFAVRNLNGSIDEFAIFASALSAAEIAEFYKQGQP